MDWCKILIEVGGFLVASYFIFYRSFLNKLGEKTAELATSKQLTNSIEGVKEKFNKDLESFKGDIQKDVAREIEPLRAALNKGNIGFQIYTTEYARLRFQRLDDLYGALYYFQKFIIDNLINYVYNDPKEFEERRQLFFKKSTEVVNKIQLAILYLDDDAKKSTFELLDESYGAFQAFLGYKNSYPSLFDTLFTGRSLFDLMSEKHEISFKRLLAARDKFPEILSKIEKEFKRNLIFNDII